MLTLVIGGAASGKSAYAEALLLRSDAKTRVYLATMEPRGAAARIARHREMRANKGFVTVERLTDISGVTLPPSSAVLLEDLGNLCANELFLPQGGGMDAVVRGVARLRASCRDLVIVSNEVFTGGADYGEGTARYLSALATLHRALAREAEIVCEVCGGVACCYKGAL